MGPGGPDDRRELGSYGVNCWIYNTNTSVYGYPANLHWKSIYVKGGSNIPIVADSMWRGGWPYEKGIAGNPPAYHGEYLGCEREMMHFCIDRHGGGAINHLFMDWSVRKVEVKELWLLKWHREFQTSGIDAPWTLSGGVTADDWPEWMRSFKDF